MRGLRAPGHWQLQRQLCRPQPWLGSAVRRLVATKTGAAAKHGKGGGAKSPPAARTGPPLNLPSTEFPMRANAAVREPQFAARCTSELYAWQQQQGEDGERPHFVLHDGPPFANGDPHMGHALNKILKDIINRYKLMQGYRVNYVPGWDCHGLPIELKALQRLTSTDDNTRCKPATQQQQQHVPPDAAAVRRAARAEAQSAVDAQRAQFERWGVMADWDNAYLTMSPTYEAAQLHVFRILVERGYVYRALRPVHWSPSSATALAEAELEYNDQHKSRAIFVRFEVEPSTASGAQALETWPGLSLVAWTTTPWSLPGNQALCIHPRIEYSVVRSRRGQLLVLATSRIAALEAELGETLQIMAALSADDMAAWQCRHPLSALGDGRPVLHGDHVTDDSGTGIVHTAPAHGYDDFLVCKEFGLEPLSPLDDSGCFHADAPGPWAGLAALDEGTDAIIEALSGAGMLISEHEHVHSYPYDWRTKKPVLTRATQQWFTDLSHLQGQAADALRDVDIIPARGRDRLSKMVTTRKEWCISRQRSWGVPIPAFYDSVSGEPLLTSETIQHVENCVAQHGTDCWWTLPTAELLPSRYRNDGRTWLRGSDTLDVWFDSGVSWYAGLQPHISAEAVAPDSAVQASLYLEGSDQYRGWFQSSLLSSVAVTRRAPYARILSHGFVLDEHGLKMSKSVGNVIDPDLVINGGSDPKSEPAYGADVIRMWVASTDYKRDVLIGPATLAAASTSLRKLRNTARFAMGNLYDFDPAQHIVPVQELPQMERFLLHRLHTMSLEITTAYEEFNFLKAQSLLMQLASADLSAFYFDTVKGRLYCAQPDAPDRRAAQTALFHSLTMLTKAMAPIAPFSAEDITAHLPPSFQQPSSNCGAPSPIWTSWLCPPPEWRDTQLEAKWKVTAALDAARKSKAIGSTLDAQVELVVAGRGGASSSSHSSSSGEEVITALSSIAHEKLTELLMVSGVTIFSAPHAPERTNRAQTAGSEVLEVPRSDEGLSVQVVLRIAGGVKCSRCWHMVPSVNADSICEQCDW